MIDFRSETDADMRYSFFRPIFDINIVSGQHSDPEEQQPTREEQQESSSLQNSMSQINFPKLTTLI